MRIFSIFDRKSLAFATPFFMKTTGEATRALREHLKDGNSLISKYPEDFELYEVGGFDDQTGRLIDPQESQFILNAASLLEPDNADTSPSL